MKEDQQVEAEVPLGPSSKTTYTTAAVLIGLFFVLYVLTLCFTPYPGTSAATVLMHSPAGQLQTYNQPVYGFLARFCTNFIPTRPHIPLGIFSLVLGIASLWLFFHLLVTIRHDKSGEEKVSRFSHVTAQWITAVVGTVCLGLCVPFWFISTRAYAQSLQIFLLLAVTSFLFSYAQKRTFSSICLFAFTLGLLLVESPTAVLLVPCLVLYAGSLVLANGDLKRKAIFRISGFLLLGLSVFPLSALIFTQTRTFEYRQMGGFSDVLIGMLRDHYIACLHVIPKAHWLTIGCFTILPWLVVVVFRKRRQIQHKSFVGSYFMHFVFTFVVIWVLANQKGSPWSAFHALPIIVTPYLFVAAAAGYLAGYWYIFLGRTIRYETDGSVRIRKGCRIVSLFALPTFIILCAITNFGYVDRRHGTPAYRMAQRLVHEIGERQWLLTTGWLDSELRLAALEARKPLKVLNLSHGQHPVYLRAIADSFESPRLRSLALVSLQAAIGEWFETDEHIAEHLATFSLPDTWEAEGFSAVPAFTGYIGIKQLAEINVVELCKKHDSFFEEMQFLLRHRQVDKDPIAALNQMIQRTLSKSANNLGVFCEEANHQSLAFEAYENALQIDEKNVSARLNRYNLAIEQERAERSEIEKDFNSFLSRMASKYRLWSLSYHYGYVRHPSAFLQRGWSWAISGRPATAIRHVQQAIALSGDEGAGLQLALASLYLADGDEQASENAYFAILEKDSENVGALLGLARLSMRRGMFDQARSYLSNLERLPVAAKIVLMETASLEILVGDLSAAKLLVEQALREDSTFGRALCTGMLLADELGDLELKDQCQKLLDEVKVTSLSERLMLVHLALRERNYGQAEERLLDVLREKPSDVHALELLLKLEMRTGRLEKAERRVHKILRVDSSHALANLVLGSIHYSRAELDLAEAAFRASIRTQPTTEGLNSLAWVQVLKKDYNEAISNATMALSFNKLDGATWDTLGVAWTHKGEFGQAEDALQKAAELKRGEPKILFHLAELYFKQGNTEAAQQILKDLHDVSDTLSPELFEEVSSLQARLGG